MVVLGRVARVMRVVWCCHGNRGEYISLAICAEVEGRGGWSGFGLGTWVLGFASGSFTLIAGF
jgi:hypothetical protein